MTDNSNIFAILDLLEGTEIENLKSLAHGYSWEVNLLSNTVDSRKLFGIVCIDTYTDVLCYLEIGLNAVHNLGSFSDSHLRANSSVLKYSTTEYLEYLAKFSPLIHEN